MVKYMEKVFGVFGDPIAHSLSPLMHNAAFSALALACSYHAFKVSPERLENAVLGAEAMGFGGLNLTVPLKEKALELSCIEPDPLAKKIGAINTLVFPNAEEKCQIDREDGGKCLEHGKILGFNTDGLGAKRALLDSAVEIEGSKILIVGAGGAARALSFQFVEAGADVIIANRTEKRALELARELKASLPESQVRGTGLFGLDKLVREADVLINATTLGMHPKTDASILEAEALHPELTVFDIVYNPLQTKLLKAAKEAGAKPISGVLMLVYQGAEAFRLWTGLEPPVELMKKRVLEALGT